jgi:hypothetical protein
LVVRARMFKSSDMTTVKKVLSYCYLGDWWVLYQLGRNSNTHFFRYLIRHIEHELTAKERRAQREERRRHRSSAQPVNGEASDESEDEDEINVSIVGSANETNGTSSSRKRHHHKIGLAYNA